MSSSGLSLSEVAELVSGRVVGDASRRISAVRPLDQAGSDDLSFLHNSKYLEAARASGAGALLVGAEDGFEGRDLVVCAQPYLGMARVLEILHPPVRPEPGIHPTAVIDETATVDSSASVGPCAVVGPGSAIGAGSIIGAGSVLGRGCVVGANSELRPRVVIEDGCEVGDRCLLHPGTVIGSDGYGFATVDGIHHKVPQVGRVVLEDDIEIGSNCCVDRGSIGITRIKSGTKLDNLIQIGHNVEVGEHCLMVAQSCIAGSATLDHHVVMAGQAGVAGHLKIGHGSMIAAKSAVMKDLEPGSLVSGAPARPLRETLKAQAGMLRLSKMRKKLAALEKRLAKLEG